MGCVGQGEALTDPWVPGPQADTEQRWGQENPTHTRECGGERRLFILDHALPSLFSRGRGWEEGTTGMASAPKP